MSLQHFVNWLKQRLLSDREPTPRRRPHLTLEALEGRTVPAAVLVTAAGAGGGPHVILRTDTNGDGTADAVTASFLAYDPSFTGGVRVAMGDFDGDGKDELVTAAGAGGGPHIKVWKLDASGAVTGLIDSFMAYDPDFRGGAWVATGDFNRDGKDELVVGAGDGGGPHIKIYSDTNGDGRLSDNLVDQFMAYDPAFRGGVRVAVGYFGLNHVGFLTTAAGPGGGPHVKIFDNQDADVQISDERVLHEFMAFAPAFRGGVFVAANNLSRASAANLAVSADAGGGPHVKLFRAGLVENLPSPTPRPPYFMTLDETDSFMAYDPAFRGGVRVAFSDLTPSDVNPDLVTAAGPGGGSHVKIWSGDAGNGRVSDRPLDDSFNAFRAADGTPLDVGVFVAFGTT